MRLASAAASAALGILGAANVAFAEVLISNFETSDGGVQQWNNPASRVADPTAASNFVLKLDATNNTWNRWIFPNWANGTISQSNANDNQTIEFDAYFPSSITPGEPTWDTASAQVWIDFEGGNGVQATAAQTITVTPNTMQHVVIDYQSLGPITVFNPGAGWFDFDLFVVPSTYTGTTYPQSVFIDNLKFSTAVPLPPPNNGTWDPTMSGNWSLGTNWQGGVIGYGAASSATFPTPAAPQTVTTDIGVPIMTLNLNGSGANGYTISGSKSVQLSASGAINVNGGTHSITAGVTIPDGIIANVGGGGSLTISNLTHDGYGGFTKTGDGTLSVNKLTNISLGVEGGALNLLPGNAQANGFMYALTVSNGATVNLNDAQVRINGMYSGTGGGTINIGAGGVINTGLYGDSGYYGTLTGAGSVVFGFEGPTTTVTLGGVVDYTGSTLITGPTDGSAPHHVILQTSMTNTSSITLDGGSTLQLASGGGSNRVIKTPSLSIASDSKIDIGDNKLITANPLGTESGGVYSGVQGMVQQASNGGAWDGPGLTTSMPDAVNGLTSIGVATGEQILGLGPTDTALFAGQTINGASTIAMYTYAGDANLDGFISGDDYASIDGNVSTPGADGWYNGDFNYDGIVSGDDYAFIDGNIVAQGAPFPTSGSVSGLTAVPEPASLGGTLAAASAALLRRRRTKR